MRPRYIRQAFVLLAALAILSNFYLDYLTYEQSAVTNRSGLLVEKAYRAVNDVDRFMLDYEAGFNKLRAENSAGHTKKDALWIPELLKRQLAGLEFNEVPASDREMIVKTAEAEIDRLATGTSHRETFLRLMQEVRAREESVLSSRRLNDVLENRKSHSQIAETTVLDALLLIFLLALFYMEYRFRQKSEKQLRSTITSLQTANSALDRVQRARHQQLQSTVHDLKNPLGSIKGFADLLRDEPGNTASVIEMTSVIQRISDNTLNLVNSLLKTDTDSPESAGAEVDLIATLLEACEELSPQMRAKGQNSKFETHLESAFVSGDRVRLHDVFTNLLGNAMKFSPPNSEISIRVETPREDRVLIEIEDEGPGFSAKDEAAAFAYRQPLSAKPSGDESSTGIGLYSSRQTVEEHGGTVEITTARSGSGACLRVELPQLLMS